MGLLVDRRVLRAAELEWAEARRRKVLSEVAPEVRALDARLRPVGLMVRLRRAR